MWIDSLCINQDDEQEKTEQVKLMTKIYANAVKTVFYRGEEDDIARIAFPTIGILNVMKDWPRSKIPVRLCEVAHLKGPDDVPNENWPLGTPDIWRPFIRFLTRPWFSRTWIFRRSFS